MAQEEETELSLEEALRFAVEEARMILPGIQALFGFQLIAVFNQRFSEVFGEQAQALHLAALVLVALSCALAMTPAAYHRQSGRRHVSRHLLALSSRFIGAAMIPLLLAISIDVGLVAYVVTQSEWTSTVLAVCCVAIFVLLWMAIPRYGRSR